MAREHVNHSDIVQFAVDKVNLPKEKADEYRAQVRRLRERIENYLAEHKDFTLRKILLSGSLAKGTSLRSLNDIDVACYISGADAPKEIKKLLDYLAERLRTAFPNFKPEQIKPNTYSVTVSFQGSGLDVDVVPILYNNDPNWYGNLVSQDDGSFVETCIPRHIEFIRSRKKKQDAHFSQVIRLAKFWARRLKDENPNFRFKSFMIELIMSKLLDDGKDFSDYPEALQHFFTYLAKSNVRELIKFTDYYSATAVPTFSDPVKIIDPVNAKNNAAKLYSDANADAIVNAAIDAGDAIDAALAAPTKKESVYYWQKIFGPSFQI
jgi:tRNA nucleotidyltransferase (CCA-adding enzyme)